MELPHLSLTAVFTLAAVLAVALGGSFALSDDEPAQPDPEQMKRIMEIVTPGKNHAMLAELVGEWNVTAQMCMPGMPDSPPENGTSTFAWAIEGRWITEHMKGLTFMGQPYEGFGIFGYDNHTKNWVSTWVSSMDTQMMTMRGVQVDPTNKITTQYGTMNEWLDNTFNKPIKVQTERIDANTFTVEIWDLQIGASGAPVIRYSYKRKT